MDPNLFLFINQKTFQIDQAFKWKISGTIKILEETRFNFTAWMGKTFIIMTQSRKARQRWLNLTYKTQKSAKKKYRKKNQKKNKKLGKLLHYRHQQMIKFRSIKRACRSRKKNIKNAIEEYDMDVTK